MLKSLLSVDTAEAEQLILVVDKYQQARMSTESSVRVHFACDQPASMTVVEFFSCFECRALQTSPSSGQAVPCAFLLPSLSEMKKKNLGSYFTELVVPSFKLSTFIGSRAFPIVLLRLECAAWQFLASMSSCLHYLRNVIFQSVFQLLLFCGPCSCFHCFESY